MAARSTLEHTQATRNKIRTSMLINRLEDHIVGKVDLSATQVTAALGLIRKTLPDLKAIEVDIEGQIDARIGWGDPHRVQSETPTGEAA
jgi:hypothetical protein